MPDLSDLFSAASVTGETENSNDILTVSHDFRKIDIPKTKKLAGVTSDEQVNTILFQCERYYGGVDLSEFSFRINYKNANGEGDQYLVTEKTVTDDMITFAWVVGRHACAYAGTIQFIVCAVKTGDGGVIQQEYNTAIHQLKVEQGLETSEDVYELAIDFIEQFRQDAEFVHEMAEHNEDSEAYAVGTKGGTPVPTTDPAYHNNSKWHSEQAATEADNSEAWAKGTKNETPVLPTDPAYHNNSKWYSEQAATEADSSESWAKGQKNGVDVDSTDATYHNNSKWYSEKSLETEARVKDLMISGMTIVRDAASTDVSIAPEAESRYIYGVLSSLTVTEWPPIGIVDIVFQSGDEPTVLTLPEETLFPDWLLIDPYSLSTSTVYELSVEDGKAVIVSWSTY